MGGIDQYTPSSRGGVLTNIPPLDNSKILLIGVLTNIPPSRRGVLTNIPPWEDFTIVLVGVPWKISSHPEHYNLFFSLLQWSIPLIWRIFIFLHITMAVAQAWLGGIGKYPPNPERLRQYLWCPEAKPTDEEVLPQPRRMRRIFFQYLRAMPMPFPL